MRPVWVRGRTAVEECPKSFVTPRSTELVERYLARKLFGGPEMTARDADAFVVLRTEERTEQGHGTGRS